MPKLNLKIKIYLILTLTSSVPLLITFFAWYLHTKYNFLDSSGQLLLFIVIIFSLLATSVYLGFTLFKKSILNPIESFTQYINNLITTNYQPLNIKEPDAELAIFINSLNTLGGKFLGDIKTFKQYEAMIYAERRKFEATLSDVTDPLITVDPKFNISFLNKAAEELTGIKSRDALGQPIDHVLHIYFRNSELPASGYLPLRKDNFDGVIFNQPDIKIVSNINKEGYAKLVVSQISQGSMINLGAILIFHDETKEKQLEAMKLDFVSMAAHELRTPLTTIKGYISVFINENEKKLSEDQMMFVRRINTSAMQLSSLVENLLSVSRVERGAMSINASVIDWVTNVKTQTELFENRAQEKRIELKFIPPSKNIPQVEVDQVRINEVLNNLVSNAINYTEPGGKIEVWIDTKGEEVITCVKDTGKGIPQEALGRLFSKFFRVKGGPAEQASKGNGLGLYLSKAIVELHKGKIWAASDGEGKGSTFCFTLPGTSQAKLDLSIFTKKV